jgi:hypothetical protein
MFYKVKKILFRSFYGKRFDEQEQRLRNLEPHALLGYLSVDDLKEEKINIKEPDHVIYNNMKNKSPYSPFISNEIQKQIKIRSNTAGWFCFATFILAVVVVALLCSGVGMPIGIGIAGVVILTMGLVALFYSMFLDAKLTAAKIYNENLDYLCQKRFTGILKLFQEKIDTDNPACVEFKHVKIFSELLSLVENKKAFSPNNWMTYNNDQLNCIMNNQYTLRIDKSDSEQESLLIVFADGKTLTCEEAINMMKKPIR